MTYHSTLKVQSAVAPDVSLTIQRVSVARRLELLRRVRDLTSRIEFYRAGALLADKLDASIASGEVESVYVIWGITKIEGLLIDGIEATPESLITSGPEDLVREAADLVRRQLGLSEDERKN
jgi:hypothetical protein